MDEFALSQTETEQLSNTTMSLLKKYRTTHPELGRDDPLDKVIAVSLRENMQGKTVEQNSQDVAEAQAKLKAKILSNQR
ncbi:hypothetical protein EL22_21385 [Halostagnicola sp. A56]|uniref:hypothetical protein n=1 Tax=Halostagnicola sp. A56 TaxID=1495067 RepID=UPI0004A17A2B|nr:hypothetical protein [Halostagnicola sp. A56]KDE56751.1 hypothetical protein EL22_21385 [Halostagnicola sp. A56]